MSFLLPATLAALAAWVYLFLAHGRFWWDGGEAHAPAMPDGGGRAPVVAALVPARNEAGAIATTLAGLFAQSGPFRLRIIVVDDESTDGTAERAEAVLRTAPPGVETALIRGAPLPAGWSGKLWALEQARRHPLARDADRLWLTDADIWHPPGTLARLLAIAEAHDRDMVSEMVRLDSRGVFARLLIPAFVYFFRLLYPFHRVKTGRRPAAAGGSILVSRSALEAAGGFAAWRDALIDDCTLARRLAARGARLWLQLSPTSISLRSYRGLADIWNMVRRTAYTELGHSPLRLLGTVVGMLWLTALPPFAAIAGGGPGTVAAGAAAWALMAITFAPSLAREGAPGWLAPLLPVAAGLFLAMTIHSAWDHHRGRRGGWKGRHYPAPAGEPGA